MHKKLDIIKSIIVFNSPAIKDYSKNQMQDFIRQLFKQDMTNLIDINKQSEYASLVLENYEL